MKTNPSPTHPQAGRSHPLLLAGVAFALGVALTGFWFHSHSGTKSGGLSDSTRYLLGQLGAPVTIRYYSLLPDGSADPSLQAFAGRAAQLLETLQAAGGGKIQLTSIDTLAETNSAAAGADGLQAFNLDKGDACYLGLAITSGKNLETFARLDPQWEAALQSDLVHAILRVADASAPAPLQPEIAKPTPEIVSSINRLIPDVSAVSAAQADQIFHVEFFKECVEVGTEAETQMNTAALAVERAQNSGSSEDLAGAQKHLLEVQLQQGEKMKQIAADLQTRMAVFQQMKSGATNAEK